MRSGRHQFGPRSRHGIARSLTAFLAACALLFHLVAMSAGMPLLQPAGEGLHAGLDVHCSGGGGDAHAGHHSPAPEDPVPSHHQKRMECPLCNHGQWGLDLPRGIIVAAPSNAIQTKALLPRSEPPPVPARPPSRQPRAPPAYA
ncbi:DUF2946 family protein [Terrihabitans sp. B22-R8]|uniref:DUF2946 family protein n=1 Tax=Terrihabitans sp. B22-R8 TaxID=3425128 RepID=UPI00403C4ABF